MADTFHCSKPTVGSYGPYSFSASASMTKVKSATQARKNIYVDKKRICNYGTVRLVGGKVTDEFYRAVRSLPTTYSEGAYFAFIGNWGTVSA